MCIRDRVMCVVSIEPFENSLITANSLLNCKPMISVKKSKGFFKKVETCHVQREILSRRAVA